MSEGIAYQNKDIEFKLMSETYKEKSFGAYGLKLPKIKELLPTKLLQGASIKLCFYWKMTQWQS